MERVKRALALYINYFLLRRNPIFVYSVERSGSVALLHSLQAHGLFAIGAHYLSPEKLSQQGQSGSARWASKHVLSKGKSAQVISMVRSPIENMLSTFAREYYGERNAEQASAGSSQTADELSQEFCQSFLASNKYRHVLDWFEDEFQQALGIDIYQHQFDQQRRFSRFREQCYDVLILGTELEDGDKAEIVADFVGLPQLAISNTALAAQTSASRRQSKLPPGKPGGQAAYAQKYQTLLQHVTIPDQYLDDILESRYVKHFFSEQQRETIRSKYCDPARHS
jgi:hypothetical protein